MLYRPAVLSCLRVLVLLVSGLSFIALTGCGSSGPPASTVPGNTSVTLLATSATNDQLFGFQLQLGSLTLTTQSGDTVSFQPIPQNFVDFIHLNGQTEPITTVSIPHGTYVSATATIETADFECSVDAPDTLAVATFSYGQTPSSQVSVTLPSPITVTGDAMGLSLALNVSKSVTYGECYSPNGVPISYTITPTFSLTPVTFTGSSTNSSNGKLTNLAGILSSATASQITVTSPDGPSLSFDTSSSTAIQGVASASALASGMAVSVDAAMQSDGSLTATRISVPDTSTTNLRLTSGPLLQVPNSVLDVIVGSQEQQGALNAYISGGQGFDFTSGTFAISGALSNLSTLPFSATFSGSNMVAGQEISITSHDASLGGRLTAATVTLTPQMIDGTITNVSSSGDFSVYTVSLASYDLFPNLAQQPNQMSVLSTPNTVIVYADQNTQQLNSPGLQVGSTTRFYGLVFNDGGTLKMDCSEIDAGVAE